MMSSKVINLNAKIKEKVLYQSKTLLLQAEGYGMKLDFSIHRLKELNNDLYTIYQYHQRVCFYEEEMNLIITNALFKKIESKNRILKLEDILDSVWDVISEKKETTIHKNKYLSKTYQIL